jgi:hypothetical protein
MTALTDFLNKLRQLGDVIQTGLSGKLGKTEQAADSAKLGGQTKTQIVDGINNSVNDLTYHVAGPIGTLPFFSEENVPMGMAPGEMVLKIRMANSDAGITALKSSTLSFQTIFNKWLRISHDSTPTQPAIPAELTSWAYDAGTDTVSSTANTNSYIGLVSPYQFDNYLFDVVLSSTGSDDDVIGLILAYRKIGGVEHTLMCTIDAGGLGQIGSAIPTEAKMSIVVDSPKIANDGGQLLFEKALGILKQNWTSTDLMGGVRVIAQRNLDGTMTVKACKPDGSNFPGGSVLWTGVLPDMFKGKCAIGYSAFSQAGATYHNITVPVPRTDIVDTRTNTVWKWNQITSSWSSGQMVSSNGLTPGRFYKDTEGFAVYYLDTEGTLLSIADGMGQL